MESATMCPGNRGQLLVTAVFLGALTASLMLASGVPLGAQTDTVPPTIQITAPTAAYTSDTAPQIIVEYADQGTGVFLATLLVELDGVDLKPSCTIGGTQVTCTPPALAEGPHTVFARIGDRAGNDSLATLDFTVDTTPPELRARSESIFADSFESGALVLWGLPRPPGPFLNDLSAPVAVSYPDAFSGADPATFNITFGGVDITAACDVGPRAALCAVPGLAEGEHIVTVTVDDRAGNTASSTLTFTVDATPPSFDPAELRPALCPTLTTDFRAPVRACFAETLSGPLSETLRLTVDGLDRTGEAVVADDCITWTPAADHAPGEHQARASLLDAAGNLGAVEWCFVIASPILDIAITSPADSFVTADATVNVSGTVDALAENVAVNGVAATLSGGTFTASGVPLVEGLNALTAIAVNSSGGEGRARVVGVRDSQPPTIDVTIDPPANAAGWHHAAATVTFECSDDLSGVASCPDPVTVSGEGADQEVVGTAVDVAGNSASVTVMLDIDLTPPTIDATVDPPANAAGWQTAPVTVTYVCDDTFSGVVACPSPVTVAAEGADQQIVGTVSDVAGNQASTTTQLSVDLTPPFFDPAELRPPTCPERTTNLQAAVRACFADPVSGIEPGSAVLTVDGVERTGLATIVDGCISWNPLTAYGPGEHVAEITATNGAGVTDSLAWCFDVDSPPIGITIDTPAPELFTRDAAIDVFGTVEEPIEAVTVNGVAAIVAAGTYQVLALPLREGRNEITAVARNTAGNTGTASVAVVRDTTAPAVRIETPRDGAVLTSLQVDVAGLVNDLIPGTTINADDCNVTINGVEAAVANRSFLVPDLLLTRGVNTLTAVARDRLGNTRSHSIEVMVEDRAGQRIVLLAGNNQAATVFDGLPDRLVVALEDANGDAVVGRPVTFEVTRGNGSLNAFPEEGGEITVMSDELGHASILYRLGSRAGAGNNRVLATAPGFLGEVEFCATAEPTFPEQVTTTAGDHQRGTVDQPLPQSLVVLVTDIGGNPVAGVGVIFRILAGGGSFAGQPENVVTTDLDGLAETVWTLGPDAGVNNNIAEATYVGLIGPPASFSASAERVRPPGETRLGGVVLDNQDNPIEGVTLHIEASGAPPPVPTAVTDAQGRFGFTGVPVGALRLIADGSTTTRPGRWPSVAFDVTTVAGQANELNQPIWLLPLADNEILVQNGGPPQDVTLLLPDVAGAEITISANSVTCPDGEAECRISWTQVRGERVPMEPPLGSSFMLAGTFQPTGAHYDPPARICIPNADEPPGGQVEIFSFDHALGEFIAVGTATVTPDGAQICSDPGFGLVTGGWHGCVPPPPPCTSACGSCPDDGDCFTYSRQCPQCGPGTCTKNNKPDGTFVSNDDPGDCMKEECQGGSPAEVGDASETPGENVTDHECKKCTENGPEADPDKDGTIVDDCKICNNGTAEEAMVELSGVPDKLCVGETVQITARVTPDVMGITGPNFNTPPELTAVGDGNNQTAQLTGNAPGNANKRELVAYFGSQPDQCDTKREELFVLPRNIEGIPGKMNRFTELSFMQAECPDYPMQDTTVNHDIDGCSGGTAQDPMLFGAIFTSTPGFFRDDPRMFNQAPTTFGAPQAAIPFGTAPQNLPCNHHDVCYQTCGSTRADCDNGMETRMNTVCRNAYPAACPPGLTPDQCTVYAEERTNCFGYSSDYRTGLGAFGSPAWTQRQTQYCLCCEAP